MDTGRLTVNTILKKQTQFPGAKMNVTSFLIMDYGYSPTLRLPKNKAKQGQFRKKPSGCRAAGRE
jgi:hypothetical protein